MVVKKSDFTSADSDADFEKEASMAVSLNELWRAIHINSFGPLALIGGLFALVCWPTSIYHLLLLLLAITLLVLLRTVARREGYLAAKKRFAGQSLMPKNES